MSWLEDARKGLLKGLDNLGRIRLDQNNGVPLPLAQLPEHEHTSYEVIISAEEPENPTPGIIWVELSEE